MLPWTAQQEAQGARCSHLPQPRYVTFSRPRPQSSATVALCCNWPPSWIGCVQIFQGSEASAVHKASLRAPSQALVQKTRDAIAEVGSQRLNAEQRMAVAGFLEADSSSAFTLFGPPGTGKTVTLTECCLQVRKAHHSSRFGAVHILPCARANGWLCRC